MKGKGEETGSRRRDACMRLPLVAVLLSAAPAFAEGPHHSIAILPFELHDNSDEGDPTGKHDPMLEALTALVRQEIAKVGFYEIVPGPRVAQAVAAAGPGTYLRGCNGCELNIARDLVADQVMVAWIFKVSNLILSLHVRVKDVASGGGVFARIFDFRGDNEMAWRRAGRYMVRSFSQAMAEAPPRIPSQ